MALSTQELQDINQSEIPAQTVTNTSIGYLINKCISTGQPITIPRWTTLNELHEIRAEESIGLKNSRDFYLHYFGIGVRGSNCIGVDSRGVSQMRVNQHQPIDANLFTAIPFIARPLDNDLDNVQRAQFRLRTIFVKDGIPYAVYWWKLINFDKYDPHEVKITRDPVTGVEDPVPYIHREDDLKNPQPVPLTSEGTVPISDVYINSAALLDCTLHQVDLREVSMACKIVFNDASYASINEVGVGYGRDVENYGEISGGQTIRYTEVESAVYAHYITERDGRNALTNTEVEQLFDHGASVPMLLHTVANQTGASQGN